MCGGEKFDSEGTSICGNCLLALRDLFGVKVIDNDVYMRIAPKKWVKCWPLQKRDKR